MNLYPNISAMLQSTSGEDVTPATGSEIVNSPRHVLMSILKHDDNAF